MKGPRNVCGAGMRRRNLWLVRLAPLACGGTSLGILQAIGDVNYAQIFTNFLSSLLSLLVQILFGGIPDLNGLA